MSQPGSPLVHTREVGFSRSILAPHSLFNDTNYNEQGVITKGAGGRPLGRGSGAGARQKD